MKKIKQGILAIAAILTVSLTSGQTNLNFIAASVNNEGAIKLTWNSTSNETYEVDEADALNTNSDGTTTWNFLYGDYPSQGTNTFWLDTGNYLVMPNIVHPKNSPQRFYRIKDLGPDTTSDEPMVTIGNITNDSILNGGVIVTVDATTDQATVESTLYVDGQKMTPAITVTNIYSNGTTNTIEDTYYINTCEWLNGNHVIFATAECASALQGPNNPSTIFTGHAVSPFVNTVFSNLVTGISFSQHFFDPSLGETQIVSAVFAANVNWTLNIEDIYTNVVFTTNGSGGNMAYPWDGNGTGEVSIPNGVYYYYISAVTNGLAYPSGGGGGGGYTSGPPSPEVSRFGGEDTITVAMPPLPPGLTNDGPDTFTITIPHTLASYADTLGGGASPYDLGSSLSSQTSPPAPERSGPNPVKGVSGTFGVAYDDYMGNGTNGFGCNCPPDGSLFGGSYIHMELVNQSFVHFIPLPANGKESADFASAMTSGGWSQGFIKANDQFSIADLRGSGTFLNNVNLAILNSHGDWGSSIDFTANQCKQMYFPITAGTGATYLRFSEMNLGGSGAGGLKWMMMDSCFSLWEPNWNSMKSAGIKPYNSNLHLLLGNNSASFANAYLLQFWAKYMTVGTTIFAGGHMMQTPPLTIRSAYYQAGADGYGMVKFNYGTIIDEAVAGSTSCMDDYLQTNSAPTGNWTYDDSIVWEPPQPQ